MTFETILNSVSNLRGAGAVCDDGEHTMQVWPDGNGGYDIRIARLYASNALSWQHVTNAADAIERMRAANMTPAQWHTVND